MKRVSHWLKRAYVGPGLLCQASSGPRSGSNLSGVAIALLTFLATSQTAPAQQVPDTGYLPPLHKPAYAEGQGPRVGVDAAHHNYHKASGRYTTFARLLRRDGYRVSDFNQVFSAETLKDLDVLVIANPLHERNVRDWSLPTPSAYSKSEVDAVQHWVQQGGALLLIADHMPFPGAASDLASAFGFRFSNGYARDGRWKRGAPSSFEANQGLVHSIVTQGHSEEQRVRRVVTFGGSAFQIPENATSILQFGPNSYCFETSRAPGISADAKKVAIDGWSQGAILEVGQGRMAVFGEAAMFSAQLAGPTKRKMGMNAPEAAENHKLLLNTMHWLTRHKPSR